MVILAMVGFSLNATGSRLLTFWKNGLNTGTNLGIVTVAAVNGAATNVALMIEDTFEAGDYVEVGVFQISGGSLTGDVAGGWWRLHGHGCQLRYSLTATQEPMTRRARRSTRSRT